MLSQEKLKDLLSILDAPVTDFDCGTLCAPTNDGKPICCDRDRIVPVLFKNEYQLLRTRSDLWRPFRPKTEQQKTLREDMRACDRLCECKGPAHCERDNRSIVCRTFPFEPYLDHDGDLAGLVWNYEFQGVCPLVAANYAIRADYIDQCLTMWDELFAADEDEWEYHWGHSETLRRSFGQKRKPIPVFTREGIIEMPTRRPRAKEQHAQAGGPTA